ncbi:MAG: hypothetical protein ACTSQJ_18260, partial [Promethearchaeota archaeon]
DTNRISPKENDPWRDEWFEMSRFEKLCWYWMAENKYLRERVGKTVQFEKIISNYEYFSQNILKPLNMEISKKIWEEKIIQPRNITIDYKYPHWCDWNEEKDIFNIICGEEMGKNGYKINS